MKTVEAAPRSYGVFTMVKDRGSEFYVVSRWGTLHADDTQEALRIARQKGVVAPMVQEEKK